MHAPCGCQSATLESAHARPPAACPSAAPRACRPGRSMTQLWKPPCGCTETGWAASSGAKPNLAYSRRAYASCIGAGGAPGRRSSSQPGKSLASTRQVDLILPRCARSPIHRRAAPPPHMDPTTLTLGTQHRPQPPLHNRPASSPAGPRRHARRPSAPATPA